MTHTQLLNAQSKSEEINNESKDGELIKYTEIYGTPFQMIRQDDKYFAVIGNAMVTDKMDTDEEVINYLWENQYSVNLRMMVYIFDKLQNEPKNQSI